MTHGHRSVSAAGRRRACDPDRSRGVIVARRSRATPAAEPADPALLPAAEPAAGARCRVLPDVLRLAVLVEARRPELTPDARSLEAAPLGVRHVDVVVIDPHGPGAQSARDPLGS